jgi:hypothetical protein
MAQQTINVGTAANDGTGDSLRAAFQKTNANTTELYTTVGTNAATVANVQTSVGLLQSKNLRFWFATGATTTQAQVAGDPMIIIVANGVAKAGVAATAQTTFDVRKNGTSIGTLVFLAGASTGTLNISLLADRTLALGDVVEISPPGTADATLARVSVVLHS